MTTCECDHLTIFAALMDPYGTDVSNYKDLSSKVFSLKFVPRVCFVLVLFVCLFVCLFFRTQIYSLGIGEERKEVNVSNTLPTKILKVYSTFCVFQMLHDITMTSYNVLSFGITKLILRLISLKAEFHSSAHVRAMT